LSTYFVSKKPTEPLQPAATVQPPPSPPPSTLPPPNVANAPVLPGAPGMLDWQLKLERAAQLQNYLDLCVTPEGLFLGNPTPPPVGTMVRLEVMLGRFAMRLMCALGVVVKSIPQSEGAPGMVLRFTFIEPGVDEDVRRMLLPCMMAPPKDTGPTADELVVGIDLGTTNSCVAVVENGVPRVIASRLGYNTVPSIMILDERGRPVIGQAAERRMLTDPGRTAYGTKRFIGRAYSKALVQQYGGRMLYEIAADSEGHAAARIDGRLVSPVEVGACIMMEMKTVAEQSLGRSVRYACVTVPAYFTEKQRNAVRLAGERAGLRVLRVVNEPTAAALCYGHKRSEQSTVLIFDLGGGTFDVSILDIAGSLYVVQATAGDTFLGGLDFDRTLADHIVADLKKKYPDANLDRGTMERLMTAAKDAKQALSNAKTTTVQLPNLSVDKAGKVVNFEMNITRETLELLTKPLVDRAFNICLLALNAAKLKPADIGDVILVGGQTRMPYVQQRVAQFFGKQPSKRVNPDEVVALGAALVAGSREAGSAPTLVDVLPVPIGLPGGAGEMQEILARNTALPADVNVLRESAPGQPLKINVYQGDSDKVEDNELLGCLSVEDPGANKGITRAELTFQLSSECLLTVKARMLRTGEEREIKLVTQQLSDDAVARMGKERLKTDLPVGGIPGAEEETSPGLWARFLAFFKGKPGK
jgi:molecular chaperone DnaK